MQLMKWAGLAVLAVIGVGVFVAAGWLVAVVVFVALAANIAGSRDRLASRLPFLSGFHPVAVGGGSAFIVLVVWVGAAAALVPGQSRVPARADDGQVMVDSTQRPAAPAVDPTATSEPAAMPTPQPTATAAVPTATLTSPPATPASGPGWANVAAADFGDRWPLTVSAGTLRCEGSRAVVFETNGRRYAVNGTAASRPGVRPLEEIWAPDPSIAGLRKNISPLLERGLSLCR